MFLAYLDSSGRADFCDKENYVLASIITNEVNWQRIENAVKAIKVKHFPDFLDSQVEIHAKDMLNRSKIFSKMDWNEIYAVLDDVFNLISTNEHIEIISVLINKSKMYKDKDVEIWAHRLLFERIDRFIDRKNEALIQLGMPPQSCIMITDSEGLKKDQRLRDKLYHMLRKGTMYSKLEYLIEDPLFTDSKWRNLSQLVDCVAYCIRKNYRQNTASDHTEKWKSYYKLIENNFDARNNTYIGYGLKIFP